MQQMVNPSRASFGSMAVLMRELKKYLNNNQYELSELHQVYLLLNCKVNKLHVFVHHFDYWAADTVKRILRLDNGCAIYSLRLNKQSLFQFMYCERRRRYTYPSYDRSSFCSHSLGLFVDAGKDSAIPT
jgi:hypothetical protein